MSWKPLQNKRLVACGACACNAVGGGGGGGGIGGGAGTNAVGYQAPNGFVFNWIPSKGGTAGTNTSKGNSDLPGINSPGVLAAYAQYGTPAFNNTQNACLFDYWGPAPAQWPTPGNALNGNINPLAPIQRNNKAVNYYKMQVSPVAATYKYEAAGGQGGGYGQAGQDGSVAYDYWADPQTAQWNACRMPQPGPSGQQRWMMGGVAGNGGAAIAGNSYVTWLANGTKAGSVS